LLLDLGSIGMPARITLLGVPLLFPTISTWKYAKESCAEWKFKPIDFWCWQDVLLQQMMRYQPNHHAYAGDKGATSAIKQNAENAIIPHSA
jgi:hypothetical protein